MHSLASHAYRHARITGGRLLDLLHLPFRVEMHIRANPPAASANPPFLAQPLAATRSLGPIRLPVSGPYPAQPNSRRTEHSPLDREFSPHTHQPRQESPAINAPEAAQGQEADQNNDDQRAFHGMGKRAQRNAALHAAGNCIWCGERNEDLNKMGCPSCLPKRAEMTKQCRVRKLARERTYKVTGKAGEEDGEETK
jgi:hypothetical protein